jgi:GH35 family endo-1,4-beta-xylanase
LKVASVATAFFLVNIAGAQATDQLLAGANARIEQHRKADATILVLDRNGELVPNAKVHIEQVGHAFQFGAAALSLLKHQDKAQEQAYQDRFSKLFNFATILTYWNDTDPEPNRQNFDLMTAQAKQLKKMGVYVKGHPLILAGSAPSWAPKDAEATRELNKKRILDMPKRFKGLIDAWDVVGDATSGHGANNGNGAWFKRAGAAKVVTDAFNWSKESLPSATRVYNEYNLDDALAKLMTDTAKLGAPIDVIGLEAHMTEKEWPIERLWSLSDQFAKHNKPLHWSEITVLSDDQQADHRQSWPSTPVGELRQADYVEKLYTLLFSHPAVTGIMWWNFVDGDWDRHPAGFLRKDLSPKPSYDRVNRLINEKWHTKLDVETNADGEVRFRGFAGRYRVVVNGSASTFDISRGKSGRIVVSVN